MKKTDYFYYARFYGIPVFFQPETCEMIGRNWFYELLLRIIEPFEMLFITENGYKIELEHKTITRQEIM